MYYYCDPRKNEKCQKSNCYLNGGKCNITEHLEYSLHERRVTKTACRQLKEQKEIKEDLMNGNTNK